MRKAALFWFGLVVTALVALGLVVLSSASEANGIRLHSDAYYFMKRQGVYLVAGVLVAVCAAAFDYRKWRDYPVLAWIFYFAVIAGLIAVSMLASAGLSLLVKRLALDGFSEGFRIIALTVVISLVAAILFPVKEEGREAARDGE